MKPANLSPAKINPSNRINPNNNRLKIRKTKHLRNRLKRKAANPNKADSPTDHRMKLKLNNPIPTKKRLRATKFNAAFFGSALVDGLLESRMILRWILFGTVLTALIRALVSDHMFADWFGPTIAGLFLTLIAKEFLT